MTSDQFRAFYTERLQEYSSQHAQVASRINLVSNLRIAVALFVIAALYLGFTYHLVFYAVPLLVLSFAILMQEHGKLFGQRAHLQNLMKVQSGELQRLDGQFSSFDSGALFINPAHPYTHDLDIFGDGSVFQYVNRSNTIHGKKRLAAALEKRLPSVDEIVHHQHGVRELGLKQNFCHEIQASGMELEETPFDRLQLASWLKVTPFVYNGKAFRVVLTVLPLATITLLILSFFLDGISPFFWLCALLQWGILAYHLKSVNHFHEFISNKKATLSRYARLFQVLSKERFESRKLTALQTNASKAFHELSTFSSLVKLLDARLNFLTNLFANSILMYDLNCIYRLERWKETHAPSLVHWLETMDEVELLVSLGVLHYNHPQFVFPEVNTNRNFHGVNLGHPLIPSAECVSNSISVDSRQAIVIITGANMAGKSTFLRTVGVNTVLALAGAPVCATTFDCPLIELRTGMRTADSLRDHQSYFFAELNRLKTIVEDLKAGRELFILLDEILKGTNSTDKQAGSIALVKQLIDYPSLVIVATHDLALGDLSLQYPGNVRNFCFEPSIIDDQLNFDYKLKEGIAQKMNATFLMRKMGIIPE